jgi:DUF1680 family protein
MEINTTHSPYAHLKTIPLKNVSVSAGFWSGRQKINHEISLKNAYQKLEDSGNFNNLKLAAGSGTGQYRKPVFMDSDVYKWLEAVSYELVNLPDSDLEVMANAAIALLAAAQQEDGYLNSYYQVVEPDKKLQELAMGHELYCAGHLFEAAVATAPQVKQPCSILPVVLLITLMPPLDQAKGMPYQDIRKSNWRWWSYSEKAVSSAILSWLAFLSTSAARGR